MQQNKYLTPLKTIAATSILLMTGCSWLPKAPEPEIITVTKPVRIEILQPDLPRQIDLKEPNWYVVSSKNLDEFIVRIKKESGGNVVFFAMSVGDYELMSYNMQELRRYIREMKEVVVYYRTVTTWDEVNETED